MTATEFRAHLARLGLSQMAFSRVVGTDPRTVRRWAAGGRIRPEIVMLIERLRPSDPVVRKHQRPEDFV